MEKNEILEKIKEVRKISKPRRFTQSWDLIINLKNYDLKKAENRIVDFIELPNGRGKKVKILAIVNPELEKDAREVFDYVIGRDQIQEIAQNKREIKKIIRKHDYVVAQVDLMPLVGRFLGRYLGPLDKMPNPKAGTIIPPKADRKYLESLKERLNRLVKVSIKKHTTFGILVGSEDMEDEKVAENIKHVIEWLLSRMPQGKQNIESIYLKLTMSPSVRLM